MPMQYFLSSVLLAVVASAPVYAAGLPDTGQSLCDDGSSNMVPCSNANTGDSALMPRQDGRFGRDPAAGGSGFDYTKVCNSGEPAGTGSCPADPALGPGANEWACTQDNITGLMWEVKTNDGGLRDRDWTYTWYDSNPATNGGDAGLADTGAGVGSDNCLDSARCDTEQYAADLNAAALCGHGDWRRPTKRELESLAHLGALNPAIDTTYFPNTLSHYYWSASTYVQNPSRAWFVSFGDGGVNADGKGGSYDVRLVRGGQL
jgi:hypothetical protein